MRPPLRSDFDVFWEKIYPQLVRLGRGRYGLSRDDVEDLIQETSVFVSREWAEKYRLLSNSGRTTYCMTQFKSVAWKYHAAKTRRRTAFGPLGLPVGRMRTSTSEHPSIFAEDDVDWAQVHRPHDEYEQQDLDARLGRLAAQQGDVFRMRALDDLPGAKVAERLGISPGSVGTQFSRAKASLRQWAEDYRNID